MILNEISRKNNFYFLRFLAASLVIIGHNFVLYGFKVDPLFLVTEKLRIGTIGVYIFFVISGFLITKSWIDKPSLISFLQKRFLRIFPALFVVVMSATFILGPLVTTLSIKEYLSHPMTWDYARNIFLFPIHFLLPGVYLDTPLKGGVNGSLWTLPVEILMYLGIAIIGLTRLIKIRFIMILILLITLFIDLWVLIQPEYRNAFVFTVPAATSIKLVIYFIVGSIFYLYKDKININTKGAILLLAVSILIFKTVYFDIFIYLLIPYLVIYTAFYIKHHSLRYIERFGDLSYGMYIFSFPVQQTLTHFLGAKINFPIYFMLVFLITIILAYLSWNLIEKQALKYKKYKLNMHSIVAPFIRT